MLTLAEINKFSWKLKISQLKHISVLKVGICD